MRNGRLFAALFLMLAFVSLASAGIVRHVVKPVVKTTAHVLHKTAKAVKTVAY